MSTIYGYMRVSSRDQNLDRQYLELTGYGVEPKHIYTDKQSGKDFNRPAYRRLIGRKIKANDILVVKSIDRLGRNYADILEEWKYITKVKKADIRILDMPLLDTDKNKDLIGTLIGDIVLQLLSFVAENERINIRQRQAEGIAAAKLRGVKFGRPKLVLPDHFEDLIQRWKNGELSSKDAIAESGLAYSTFYKKAKLFSEPKK